MALLGAFDEPDWQRKLPQLAERLVEMGPSHNARFKARRGWAVCVGALLAGWVAACCVAAVLRYHPPPLTTALGAPMQLLRKLPAAHPRGLALQQFAGALLLERLLPPSHRAPRSAVNRREAAVLDPAAVLAAQPWFGDGKGLVAGATSGGAGAGRGGYQIGGGGGWSVGHARQATTLHCCMVLLRARPARLDAS